jgi:hypothetical protein
LEEQIVSDDPVFVGLARAELASRFAYDAWYGTGSADPTAARAAPEGLGPAARLGFALEAVRLLAPAERPVPVDLVAQVRAVWAGAVPPPRGAPLAPEHRHGRYHPPIAVPSAADLDRLPMYGGGARLVASDDDDDLVVAILEAMYFRPEIQADPFVGWLDHPSPAVRYTAALCVRVTPSPTLDHEAVLRELAASPDPGLAAHGHDGLRLREWTLFTGQPGRGGR